MLTAVVATLTTAQPLQRTVTRAARTRVRERLGMRY
jgi:hypothetical protein